MKKNGEEGEQNQRTSETTVLFTFHRIQHLCAQSTTHILTLCFALGIRHVTIFLHPSQSAPSSPSISWKTAAIEKDFRLAAKALVGPNQARGLVDLGSDLEQLLEHAHAALGQKYDEK